MNVMNRKLFANRNARRRLANMGGIIASSPELLGTAQTFANGGSAVVKTVLMGAGLYDVKADGQIVPRVSGVPLDPTDPAQAELIREVRSEGVDLDGPTIGANTRGEAIDMINRRVGKDMNEKGFTGIMQVDQPLRIERAIQYTPDNLLGVPLDTGGLLPPKLESAPITENEAGIGSGFPKIPDSRKAKDKFFRGELADQIRRDGLPSIATPDDENPMVKLIEAGIDKVTTPFKPDTTNNPPNPYQSDIDAAVESFTGPAIGGNLEGQDESGSTLSGDNFMLPPTEGYPYPKDAPEVVEEEKKKLKDDPKTKEVKPGNRGFTPIEDVYINPTKEQINNVEKKVNEEVKKPDGGNANSVASSALLQSVGVDTSNMGLKERVQSMQEMMSELVGYSDEDEKKQFWLTMAGIGFQIASGQSSKALVNIAEGLAQGAKKFSENQATRQARKDKLGFTALGEVLADDRATRKFGRDLQIAKVRASASSTDKYTAERERSRIKELIYKSPFDYPGLLGDDDTTPDPDKVNKYLDQVVEIADAEPVIVTQEEAIADAKRVIEQRPELKDKVIEVLKKKGYNTEGL
tara:strand:- start:190 stop:1923 length:1734 start_codon:yes stop_codon:yes gene_type:complete